jgi:hypothetical protein
VARRLAGRADHGEELNQTETIFPGSRLPLSYAIRVHAGNS